MQVRDIMQSTIKGANEKISKFLVMETITVKDAMKQIGQASEKILFVVDPECTLLGSLTDGDIRRWVLSEGSLNETIQDVYFRSPSYVWRDYKKDDVKKTMLEKRIEWIPVISKDQKIIDILLWEDIFGEEEKTSKTKINSPVVIMAGGKGTRLDPFTRVLPKPLIPIGEKTLIEMIMDKFYAYQIKEFYLSINHKSRIIKAYFEETSSHYKINFIEETKALGTAGSLQALVDRFEEPIIVSNCDIVIEANYNELLEHHKSKQYDLTIVGSFRHLRIPYGVCKIEDGGALVDIDEKPEYDFLANTGMYIINNNVLKLIPQDKFFNMTDLIKRVKETGGSVGVFPIDEKSWVDIGQLEEYRNALKILG